MPVARFEISYHHAIDVVPTLLDCVGVDLPDTVKGYTQHPIQGVSMRYSFDAGNIPTAKHTQFYSMLGGRGIWHDGWKAVTTHPTLSGWGPFLGRHLGALPHRVGPSRAPEPCG